MREGRAARHAASIQDFIIASYRIAPITGAYAEMMSETLIRLNICGANGSAPQACRFLRGVYAADLLRPPPEGRLLRRGPPGLPCGLGLPALGAPPLAGPRP